MIDPEYLPFFIKEDLYILNEDIAPQAVAEPTPIAIKPNYPSDKVENKEIEVKKSDSPTLKKTITHSLAIWTPPLHKEDKELLVKILAAVGEDFNKVFIMEGIASYSPNYQKLICFGYQKEMELKTKVTMELYIPQKMAEKDILISASPADLHSDTAQKKRLWEALKVMYKIG